MYGYVYGHDGDAQRERQRDGQREKKRESGKSGETGSFPQSLGLCGKLFNDVIRASVIILRGTLQPNRPPAPRPTRRRTESRPAGLSGYVRPARLPRRRAGDITRVRPGGGSSALGFVRACDEITRARPVFTRDEIAYYPGRGVKPLPPAAATFTMTIMTTPTTIILL